MHMDPQNINKYAYILYASCNISFRHLKTIKENLIQLNTKSMTL